MKAFIIALGLLAAILIVSQLVMGLLILQGSVKMVKAHQHSGYLTVATTLLYIALSLSVIGKGSPSKPD